MGAAGAVYVVWRASYGIASTFLTVTERMAEWGFMVRLQLHLPLLLFLFYLCEGDIWYGLHGEGK